LGKKGENEGLISLMDMKKKKKGKEKLGSDKKWITEYEVGRGHGGRETAAAKRGKGKGGGLRPDASGFLTQEQGEITKRPPKNHKTTRIGGGRRRGGETKGTGPGVGVS